MVSSTEYILEVIKKHPILYHPRYNQVRKDDRVWETVGVQVKMTGNELKRKWKNIRDTYAKYLRSIHTNSIEMKHYRNWQYASNMHFFRPYLPFVKRIEEVSTKDDRSNKFPSVTSKANNNKYKNEIENPIVEEDMKVDISDSQYLDASEFLDPIVTEFVPNENLHSLTSENSASTSHFECFYLNEDDEESERKIEKTNKVKIKIERTEEMDNEAIQNITNTRNNLDLDGNELLFMGYARLVREFSMERQAIIKMKIAQLMMEQELEHIQELNQSNKHS